MSSRLDVGRALALSHPRPALANQGLRELMGAQGKAGQAGQWPKKGGGHSGALWGCPSAPCPLGQGWAWAIFSSQMKNGGTLL